jgi:uncharacterized integral membrane protein
MNIKSISIIILLALFITVCIQNVEIIPVHFLFWKIEISKLLLLIITLVIGILIGMIIPGFFSRSKKDEQIKVKGAKTLFIIMML